MHRSQGSAKHTSMSHSWGRRAYVELCCVEEHMVWIFVYSCFVYWHLQRSPLFCITGCWRGSLQAIFLTTLCQLASNWTLTVGDAGRNSKEGGGEKDAPCTSSFCQLPWSRSRRFWLQSPTSFVFLELAMLCPLRGTTSISL